MTSSLAASLAIGYYSVFPSILELGLLFLLAATPLFRAADSPPSAVRHRVVSLDGLRGFLALAVVFHHVSVYHVFLTTGIWTVPPSRFYSLLGPFGVSLFFMITGYLFWGRLVRVGGRMDWRTLYTGRLFRIGPLFMVAALVLLGMVAVHTGFERHVADNSLVKQVVRWLSLGFFLGKSVNGWANAQWILAGATWSVQWEWYFYLSLPVLALIARKPSFQLPVVLGLLMLTLAIRILYRGTTLTGNIFPYCDLFLSGMLCASVQQRFRVPVLPDWVGSSLLILCCTYAIVGGGVYSVVQFVALTIAFHLVISGYTVFGLLLTRPARRLGDISYGIYLLQGLALFFVFQPAPMRRFALSSPLHHWLLAMVAASVLLVLATAAHVWIERPGIRLGKHLSKRWAKPRQPAGQSGD